MITVFASKMPSPMVTYSLPDGSTVQDLLNANPELQGSGFEIRIDNELVSPSTVLSNGKAVMLMKQIKGNEEN